MMQYSLGMDRNGKCERMKKQFNVPNSKKAARKYKLIFLFGIVAVFLVLLFLKFSGGIGNKRPTIGKAENAENTEKNEFRYHSLMLHQLS